jgi:hypothetical protein
MNQALYAHMNNKRKMKKKKKKRVVPAYGDVERMVSYLNSFILNVVVILHSD